MSREIGNACMKEAAEILGTDLAGAEAAFGSWMNETFPELWAEAGTVAGLDDEDFDQFTDLFVLAVRPVGSGGVGGGKGEEWVGAFIGFDRRIDMMRRKREMAVDIATADLSGAIKNGFSYNGNKVGIGRAFTAEGVWRIEHGSGTYVSDKKADERPAWVISLNEKVDIAMLKPDNTPTLAYMVKSVWTFHGNTQEKFLEEGPITVKVEGQWEAAEHDWRLWEPVRVKGEFDPEGWKGTGPTLSISNPGSEYGLAWAPEQSREAIANLFKPEQFLTTCGDALVNLGDLLSHHLENREESYVDRNGVQRYDGPLVVVVGGVMDVNHEGRESQWDPTGRDFYMSVSNQVLRREDPNARVGVSVSGIHHDRFNALKVLKNGEWLPYARGSRVWIVGRTDSYTNTNGEDVVKVQAQGIYAVPNKSIPAQKPSADANDLGNLSGFGVGGDE